MSEVPRNRSFARAASSSQGRSDSPWSSTSIPVDAEEVLDKDEDYNHATGSPRNYDAASMYGMSPAGLSQSSWRRPSGASNLSGHRSAASVNSRRPSSSSGPWSSKASIESGHSMYTASAQSPTSPPSTPKNRSTSSRSKILASSAAVLENSPPIMPSNSPPPHSRNSSFSTDVSLLPRSISPASHQAGKGGILVSTATGQSLLERKRRLALASGSSAYEDANTDASSVSTMSHHFGQRGSDQASNVSSGESSGTRRHESRRKPATIRDQAVSDHTSSDAASAVPVDNPTSLKKRLFGGSRKDKTPPKNSPSVTESNSRNFSSSTLQDPFKETRPQPSRAHSYSKSNRPSTAGGTGSPSMLSNEPYDYINGGTANYTTPSTRSKSSGRKTITESATYPRMPKSETSSGFQEAQNGAATDYGKPKTMQRLGSSAAIETRSSTPKRASLRSVPSESSIKRLQNDSTITQTERPTSRTRANSRGSASVHSNTSFGSGNSIPNRTTSLKQGRAAPSSPTLGRASLVSPSSSYKSIPTSPDLLPSTIDTTLSSSPIKNSLNKGISAKHSSWRQSSALSTAAAAGPSGASALAAIRASFGEPLAGQNELAQEEGKRVGQPDVSASLSFAALRILEEPDPKSPEQDGGRDATMSKLTGLDADRIVKDNLKTESDLRQFLSYSTLDPRKEPLRPSKSPLRGTPLDQKTSSMMSESGHGFRSVSAPMPNEARRIPTSNSTTNNFDLYRMEQLSPPRKSIEEMSVVDMMMHNEGFSTSGSVSNFANADKSQTSLRSRENSQSNSSTKVKLGSDKNASAVSLLTDDGVEGENGKGDPKNTLATRYKTLRKVTPPIFNMSFGNKHANKQLEEEGNVSNHSASNLGHVDEHAAFVVPSAPSSSAIPGPRKKSIWRLGSSKEETMPTTSSTLSEALSSSTTKSKLGMSIRGRKSDAPIARPTIRRVFDNPTSNDSLNNASLTGDSSQNGDDSKTATPPTGDTTRSFATIQSMSNDSLQRQLGMDSSSVGTPGTPQTPSDSLPEDMKRLLRRCNAIRELVETERTYASDLGIVRDLYLGRAKALSGMSTASPLTTPLSSSTTPILASGLSTPVTMQGLNQSSSSSYISVKGTPPINHWGTSTIRHQSYPEAPLASPAQIQTSSTNASSSGPSNRSSTYTTSSHASSDLSFHWPPNGNSLPGTPSVGPPSTHKSTNASSASPAPSLQQQQQAAKNAASVSKIQTSLSGTPVLASEGPLSARDMRIIFAHLESTCAFAFELHSLLNSSMGSLAREKINIRNGKASLGPNNHQDDDRIGQLFVTLMPRIEAIFTAYCSRHEASVLRLQELYSQSTKAANYFRECTEVARKSTTAWDLGSLLIKPVQRVLKYPLLLRQIVSLTDKSHPDYAQLNTALVQIEEVADKINRVKRRRDLADLIITGKDRDGKGNSSSPLASMPSSKSKKKGGLLTPRSSNAANAEDSMLNVEALDNALEKYADLTRDFEALQSRVSIFGRQCGAWSHSLRECYYAQLRMLGCLRKVYNLRLIEDAEGGQSEGYQASQRPAIPSGPEDAVVSAYMEVMKGIINRSWRQMDTEIQTAILPMTQKIERMFEAPRSVMIKRDDRENDFARARFTLHQDNGSGKNLDRKALENANGFVALQAQLIDELPIFMRGIQLLLDVGVQAFARLQAGHLDEVRHLTIEFWRTKAGHGDEVEMIGLDGDDSIEVGPSLRNVHPVRAFWDSHRAYSQWSDSLSIARRGSELSTIPSVNYDDLSDSDDGESDLEEAIAKANATGLLGKPASSSNLSHGLNLRRSSNNSPSTNSNSGHNPAFLTALNSGRRPSGGGVVGLMRTLSGTFSRDHSPNPSINSPSETELPPMPDGASDMIQMHRAAASANATQNGSSANGNSKGKSKFNDDPTITVSSLPPSLPSLVFRRDGDTGEGFFVQNSPIDFLDRADHVPKKEPYDLSPAVRPIDLSSNTSPSRASDQSSGFGSNGVEMASDLSSLSIGTDGNTSTRSGSFVSAESVRTRMPSRENSADRLQLSRIAEVGGNGMKSSESGQFTTNTLRPQGSQSSQRQKMKALFQCKAMKDGPEQFNQEEKHLGWQFVQYKVGDTFRVLSRDSSSFPNQTLLFGRSDINGQLGWVEQVNFSDETEQSS